MAYSIGVVNQSTMVSNTDVDTMTKAIQKQLDLHMLPAWNLKAASVKFYADASKVPGYAWTIYVIDNDAQVAGALGYHQEETSDKIDGFIMCQPVLSNGGGVLAFDPSNPGQYTVSATLSHEIIETVGDRFTNTFCDNGSTSWCQELCDPCEQIGYGVMVGSTNVSVSDFCFPSFFNPYATLAKNAPFNYLNTLKAPFTMLAGGYSIQRTGGPGSEKQVFGEAMPQWRRDMKSASFARAARRVG
jgi:hypothetical protein